MTQNNISWIFDEEGFIVTSRIVHLVDETRERINNISAENVDNLPSLMNNFIDALDILDEICKNPTKVK